MVRVKPVAVMVVALVVVGAAVAWADVATPRPQWTTVRMAAEEVNITLGEQRIQVDATFQMQNMGAASTVRMGYPLGLFETELRDFAVFVDGQPFSGVRTEENPGGAAGDRTRAGMAPGCGGAGGGGGGPAGPAAEPYRFGGPYRQWQVFDVPFGANERKAVRVTYWVAPARLTDAERGSLLFYSYTLRTGATWKGKIDQATIRVRLDGVAPDRLVRVSPVGSERAENGRVITWTMRDFKPADDIEIAYRPASPAAPAVSTAR
jgi:hypothetical protein